MANLSDPNRQADLPSADPSDLQAMYFPCMSGDVSGTWTGKLLLSVCFPYARRDVSFSPPRCYRHLCREYQILPTQARMFLPLSSSKKTSKRFPYTRRDVSEWKRLREAGNVVLPTHIGIFPGAAAHNCHLYRLYYINKNVSKEKKTMITSTSQIIEQSLIEVKMSNHSWQQISECLRRRSVSA